MKVTKNCLFTNNNNNLFIAEETGAKQMLAKMQILLCWQIKQVEASRFMWEKLTDFAHLI